MVKQTSCKEEHVEDNEIVATTANFQSEVLSSSLPVLVDFWAVWCAPCRMIAPVVSEIANEYTGKLKVARLNVDDNQEIAARYGIMSIPTLALFKGGVVIDQVVGAVPKRTITAKIDGLLQKS
ncbi:MAG: thioredoxin [Coprothermobacter sp.]|nr:thioredoxin [Coprothermobacter sp.]